MSSAVPTVSVITPTYNKADLLRETIASVLAQTIPPLEVLVADDGSTDHTAEVIASFGNRVTHLRVPHRGQPAAPRNAALSVARGEWIALCDHDDLWLPDKLERQFPLIAPGVGIICSNASIIGDDGHEVGHNLHQSHPLAKEPDPVHAMIGGNFVMPSSVLVPAALLREFGGFSEDERLRGADDYDLWMRMGLRTKIVYDHAPRIKYRLGQGNLSLAGPKMLYVEKMTLIRERFIAAAGARAETEFRVPLAQNWRHLQHARYKAHLSEGRWWRALGPWLSVQAAKVRGRD